MGTISVQKFKESIVGQVAAHSIYVWGASGQLCKDIDESWIRQKEARNENGAHADDAVAAWKSVMAGPYRDVARAFDCSGFVSWCLIRCGALSGRKDCDGLYDRCETADTIRDGMLLFRVNPKNPSDETHVGVYAQGKQYHSKGRTYGVVEEPFDPSYWQKYGWFKALAKGDPIPTPALATQQVRVRYGTVNVRTGPGKDHPRILTARGKQTFPLLLIDPTTGWYKIDLGNGQAGYISNRADLTEVLYGTR